MDTRGVLFVCLVWGFSGFGLVFWFWFGFYLGEVCMCVCVCILGYSHYSKILFFLFTYLWNNYYKDEKLVQKLPALRAFTSVILRISGEFI